ncbi:MULTISPECIES: DUF5134 domain-containing protein [unclassified Mycolicibacterium]|uniref:DUF5134 domain-containing protein n=1 Tax=unclassified Mycolicibacterium TaxID=2636767 RepID=UPI0012DEAA21|nr:MULTISPECIES: DUF5134 domain-containing protein [unclassified Mycolicibacterium]MUL83490.1 DUF5134 domain-containing protein [Mycolicibacterium sp. CBMA 329]MUL90481.1 DUF5134 domain-containing protein [Mycolicibacterium sp. CBMA 331]MUM00453.1 DUF5134 domain-containing protein [Mycolicibacterium sp. CBMA 334]MUM28748.1 DUF5134 domain-containing protein [Mycolicibacterium sp. CBMA 295]MUM41425.1 DUF5134 domain-containing protein [Mycolicibacterium sp. CBMA 247]
MIADLALRWVVTVLFALSAAECIYAFAGSHHRLSAAVSQLLHLAMAVAMLVMAWPRGAELPTLGPMFFFLAAAVWFVAGLVRSGTSESRVVNGYHSAMMLAMAWMYAVMNGNVLVRHTETIEKAGHDMHAAHMTGHHAGSTTMAMEHAAAQPLWIPAINWLLTIGFVIATTVWLYRYFAARQQSETSPFSHFGTFCQAMMAAGMAIMFGVML